MAVRRSNRATKLNLTEEGPEGKDEEIEPTELSEKDFTHANSTQAADVARQAFVNKFVIALLAATTAGGAIQGGGVGSVGVALAFVYGLSVVVMYSFAIGVKQATSGERTLGEAVGGVVGELADAAKQQITLSTIDALPFVGHPMAKVVEAAFLGQAKLRDNAPALRETFTNTKEELQYRITKLRKVMKTFGTKPEMLIGWLRPEAKPVLDEKGELKDPDEGGGSNDPDPDPDPGGGGGGSNDPEPNDPLPQPPGPMVVVTDHMRREEIQNIERLVENAANNEAPEPPQRPEGNLPENPAEQVAELQRQGKRESVHTGVAKYVALAESARRFELGIPSEHAPATPVRLRNALGSEGLFAYGQKPMQILPPSRAAIALTRLAEHAPADPAADMSAEQAAAAVADARAPFSIQRWRAAQVVLAVRTLRAETAANALQWRPFVNAFLFMHCRNMRTPADIAAFGTIVKSLVAQLDGGVDANPRTLDELVAAMKADDPADDIDVYGFVLGNGYAAGGFANNVFQAGKKLVDEGLLQAALDTGSGKDVVADLKLFDAFAPVPGTAMSRIWSGVKVLEFCARNKTLMFTWATLIGGFIFALFSKPNTNHLTDVKKNTLREHVAARIQADFDVDLSVYTRVAALRAIANYLNTNELVCEGGLEADGVLLTAAAAAHVTLVAETPTKPAALYAITVATMPGVSESDPHLAVSLLFCLANNTTVFVPGLNIPLHSIVALADGRFRLDIGIRGYAGRETFVDADGTVTMGVKVTAASVPRTTTTTTTRPSGPSGSPTITTVPTPGTQTGSPNTTVTTTGGRRPITGVSQNGRNVSLKTAGANNRQMYISLGDHDLGFVSLLLNDTLPDGYTMLAPVHFTLGRTEDANWSGAWDKAVATLATVPFNITAEDVVRVAALALAPPNWSEYNTKASGDGIQITAATGRALVAAFNALPEHAVLSNSVFAYINDLVSNALDAHAGIPATHLHGFLRSPAYAVSERKPTGVVECTKGTPLWPPEWREATVAPPPGGGGGGSTPSGPPCSSDEEWNGLECVSKEAICTNGGGTYNSVTKTCRYPDLPTQPTCNPEHRLPVAQALVAANSVGATSVQDNQCGWCESGFHEELLTDPITGMTSRTCVTDATVCTNSGGTWDGVARACLCPPDGVFGKNGDEQPQCYYPTQTCPTGQRWMWRNVAHPWEGGFCAFPCGDNETWVDDPDDPAGGHCEQNTIPPVELPPVSTGGGSVAASGGGGGGAGIAIALVAVLAAFALKRTT
jgi:hypothetical protein